MSLHLRSLAIARHVKKKPKQNKPVCCLYVGGEHIKNVKKGIITFFLIFKGKEFICIIPVFHSN